MLDVELECLRDAPGPIKDLARVRFHHGSAEILARVKLLGRAALSPGEGDYAQLRLERPVVALPGDRFILRRYSPTITIAGGRILHNRPSKMKASAPGMRERFVRLADGDPIVVLRELVEEAGATGVDTVALRALTGDDPEAIVGRARSEKGESRFVVLPTSPPRLVAGPVYARLRERVVAALQEFHGREPLKEGLSREEVRTRVLGDCHPEVIRCLLADLADRGTVRAVKDWMALASHRVDLGPEDARLLEQIEQAFAIAGTNPPSTNEVTTRLKADAGRFSKLLHLLLTRGRLVRIPDARIFHVDAIEQLKRRLWEKRASSPTIEIAEFKKLTGTSRKNAIPLLEHLDQIRVTRREGNVRVILPPPETP
jgi:selenocysteine-specific elongation factor